MTAKLAETSRTNYRESEIRELTETLQFAIDAADLGMWQLDLRTDELKWSPRCSQMFGVLPEDPLSLDIFYEALHPDDRDSVRAAFERTVDPDIRAAYDTEYRVIGRTDGRLRWVAAKGRAFFNERNEGVRAVGMVLDITRRKQDEIALRQLTEELEARVGAEVAVLEEAQARLAKAQRLEALGQLAGGIAHDVNNVLQTVAGGARLMATRLDKPDELLKYAGMIAEATERGATITNRLLAVARHSELSPVPLDCSAILADLPRLLAATIGSDITLRVVPTAGAVSVFADPRQLDSVLINLAANARDAMPSGGTVTVTATAETVGAQRPHPAGLGPGEYVRVDVTDSGAGMDRATLARVAEPFFTTKPRGQGNGLGLAMARGFAQQSGGTLRIDSVLGRGTTASIWLPQARPAPIRAASRAEPASLIGPARILIVDDEEMVREVLVAQVSDQGHQTLSAANGEEALDTLRGDGMVDLIITDLSMPGMDGVTLIDHARALRPTLPAIVLTGYAGDSAASSPALTGKFSLLQKPISGRDLAARITDALNAASCTPRRFHAG